MMPGTETIERCPNVVIGAGGCVADAVIKALLAEGKDVRGIGRNHVDARDTAALTQAIAGAGTVFLCVGLPYRTKIWQRDWPLIMKAALSACSANDARLVFFDNCYMYGPAPLAVPLTEQHSQQPVSRKGSVRKMIADMAMAANEEGSVSVVIGRSADFYGPGAVNSPFFIRFLENILDGKRPQTLIPDGPIHSYTYVPDAARALVRLAFDDGAMGQVWHLPSEPPVDINTMIVHFESALGRELNVQFLPRWVRRALALVSADVYEASEMAYQFDSDFVFSDARFRERYPDFATTALRDGVKSMVDHFNDI